MSRSVVLVVVSLLALGACTSSFDEQGSLYDQLKDGDVSMAAATLQRSLEQTRNGETTSWRNTSTAAAGSITPTRTFLASDGAYCRDYDETIAVGAKSGHFLNTACRNENGTWLWI